MPRGLPTAIRRRPWAVSPRGLAAPCAITSGDFCYDSKRGDTTGTTSVAGANSWAFEFDLNNNTASVNEDYAKNYNERCSMKGLEESPAVVNKPMFVKFNIRTDTQKLFVIIVATPLPKPKATVSARGS